MIGPVDVGATEEEELEVIEEELDVTVDVLDVTIDVLDLVLEIESAIEPVTVEAAEEAEVSEAL